MITASYSPSLIEIGVSMFVLAYGLIAFTPWAKDLPIFSKPR
jgi:hypothetical protein